NNHHLTVEGESRNKIAKDQTLMVDGSAHHKTGKLYAVDAGSEVHLKGGAKIIIEAGSELTLKAGGSFVKVDASGVSIVGPAINLNSGGSPGSGSGYGGIEAALPMGLEALAAPEELLIAPTTASMTSLLPALATLDVSLSELCQKRTDGSCSKTNCECINHDS
ncbi:type VI secretion system tip protein VgrG, partial [Vibrio hepatarius]|nr:type VI secretion system tip protein VgrG [Vibrio hepatarius]